MRVLLLPANNAPEFQVEALESLITGTDNEVVRWHPSLRDDHYDITIFIAGEHNEKLIRALWNNYQPDEPMHFDYDEYDDFDVYLGRGLYGYADTTKKPCYLLLAPEESDSKELKEAFMNNVDSKGPAFLAFDRSDVDTYDETNYTKNYGVLYLYAISDNVAYSFSSLIKNHGGGDCVAYPQPVEFSYEQPYLKTSSSDPETSTSLLLLRRVR